MNFEVLFHKSLEQLVSSNNGYEARFQYVLDRTSVPRM